MGRKGKVVVTGLCFSLPTSGVIYQVLHYLRGLRQLGYDVYYVEETRHWIHDMVLDRLACDASGNVSVVAAALDAHGFSGHWAFRADYEGGQCYGMSEDQIVRLYVDADALLNVTGAQEMREQHLACRRRIYIQSDPFALQVLVSQGDAVETSKVAAHDTHFTFGENIGAADSRTPVDGFRWLPTRQPVDLELWHPPAGAVSPEKSAYTTITTWRNNVAAIDHQGETYHWQKHLEFEKFLDVPRRCPVPFELAVGLDEHEQQLLRDHGWRHLQMTGTEDLERYRGYIWRSRAEFTVARDQYVRPRTGWFSDRSACYLAASKPVIAQETGFSKVLPTGLGLFGFTTTDDVAAAVDAIETDYERHSRAAREIAAEYFAADKVVGSLMQRAGL